MTTGLRGISGATGCPNNPQAISLGAVGGLKIPNFTLTEGIDLAQANVFVAPRGWTPGGTDQVNTLDDDDVLTGTGDNPTLNLTFVGGVKYFV